MHIKAKGTIWNLIFTSAYASTEGDTERKKLAFYDLLDRESNKTPKYDVAILLGDFSAMCRGIFAVCSRKTFFIYFQE